MAQRRERGRGKAEAGDGVARRPHYSARKHRLLDQTKTQPGASA